MARQLPEKPPTGLVPWAIDKHGEKELGGEFLIFFSERVRLDDGRWEWAAFCTCTACQEEFCTQKEPGEKAIRMILGEDGSYYTVDPGMDVDPYMGIEINRQWDELYCPICGSKVTLLHKSTIKGGRTKRMMVVAVQDVQGYAALVYWMVERHLTEYGLSKYIAKPEEAYVLTEHGGLVRYSHVQRHGAFYGANRSMLRQWKPMANCQDVVDKVYPDWLSSCNKKCGGDIWPEVSDLEGTTGEKTALDVFVKAGGWPPVVYLKLWRRKPAVENLCRQGQSKLVADICHEAYRYSYDPVLEAKKYLDLSKKKPHEMMGMTKEEFRWLRKNQLEIDLLTMKTWKRYKKLQGKLGLDQFAEISGRTGMININTALDLMEEYGDELDKLKRYMDKVGGGLREIGTLRDTRTALKRLYARELTQEELWPRNLQEVHDRANRMLMERKCQKEAEKLREGFRKVVEDYGQLQWNDGELCVVLPKDNGELVREGDVLRHCVGGYGGQHVGRSSVIFFIRHYRRPERPYYTLAINMKDKPYRCQLHGYGNECHGKHKEYRHSIPKKVLDFCDRWENEVLLAWYAQQRKNQKEEKTA